MRALAFHLVGNRSAALPARLRHVQHALVELGPAHVDGLARAQPMSIDQTDQYLVAERMPATLACGIDQTVSFIWSEIAPVLHFRLFAR